MDRVCLLNYIIDICNLVNVLVRAGNMFVNHAYLYCPINQRGVYPIPRKYLSR